MAQKSPEAPPVIVKLPAAEIRKAITRFEKLIELFEDFDPQSIQERGALQVKELGMAAQNAVERTYPTDSAQYERLSSLWFLDRAPINMIDDTPIEVVRNGYNEAKAEALILLRQEIENLKEDLEDRDDAQSVAVFSPADFSKPKRTAFIVHGHNEGAREAVARFLQSIDIKPIILHEQANKGLTVIEKFEAHSNVGFAIVLLTPDDVGGVSKDQLQPRARQNVILELGYFFGRLARGNVCALKMGELELPSDFVGITYTDYDDKGAWKQELAKELQAAGIDIDWNKVMKP